MQKFLDDGEYLPDFIKDFHDQKTLFKMLNQIVEAKKAGGTIYEYQLPNWIEAHIYTIDIFLWFMGKHGYKLQKSRKKVKFDDIYEKMDAFEKERMQQGFRI